MQTRWSNYAGTWLLKKTFFRCRRMSIYVHCPQKIGLAVRSTTKIILSTVRKSSQTGRWVLSDCATTERSWKMHQNSNSTIQWSNQEITMFPSGPSRKNLSEVHLSRCPLRRIHNIGISAGCQPKKRNPLSIFFRIVALMSMTYRT